jgi:hypothetical protein
VHHCTTQGLYLHVLLRKKPFFSNQENKNKEKGGLPKKKKKQKKMFAMFTRFCTLTLVGGDDRPGILPTARTT